MCYLKDTSSACVVSRRLVSAHQQLHQVDAARRIALIDSKSEEIREAGGTRRNQIDAARPRRA
jgi:hypothetical protein